VTPSRTVVIGSALPFLLLVGLIGLPALRSEPGLQVPQAIAGGTVPLGVVPASVRSNSDAEASADAAGPEASALRRLRSSLLSGRRLGFSGTEVVRSWRAGGSATWRLNLVQRPGSPRLATVQSGSTGQAGSAGQSGSAGQAGIADGVPGGDPLTALSARAIVALAAGYQLRLGPSDTVAGRSATVVIAARDGRDLGKFWLDKKTGLLLRQDVMDRVGRVRRTASFLTLSPDRPSVGTAADMSTRASARTAARIGPVDGSSAPTDGWNEVTPTELARWQAAGWPCLQELADGYVLLDVRRGPTGAASSAGSALQLVYGDGLSAISVFVQQGQLDAAGLTGLTSQAWGDGTVLVRTGWPEVLVWQGGRVVFTAIGDDDPGGLQAVLSPLPQQPDRGTLGSLQHGMGSALAWFKD
jgi:sigma-E factor negative regulatory protein RseB